VVIDPAILFDIYERIGSKDLGSDRCTIHEIRASGLPCAKIVSPDR
jgi:hypothetical protein